MPLKMLKVKYLLKIKKKELLKLTDAFFSTFLVSYFNSCSNINFGIFCAKTQAYTLWTCSMFPSSLFLSPFLLSPVFFSFSYYSISFAFPKTLLHFRRRIFVSNEEFFRQWNSIWKKTSCRSSIAKLSSFTKMHLNLFFV